MPGYDMEPLLAGRQVHRVSIDGAARLWADRNRIMLYDRSSGGMREVTYGLIKPRTKRFGRDSQASISAARPTVLGKCFESEWTVPD